MKKITLLLTVCLALTLSSLWAQKVAVVGMNHISSSPNRDGFSFVALQDLTAVDIIYFTEKIYDANADAFTGSDSFLKFVPSGTITKGTVVFLRETGTSTNVFDVICTGGGVCGTATNLGGSFSLNTNGDHLYAYEDTDDDITNGITTIYALMYTGSGSAPIQNGGNVPFNQNPTSEPNDKNINAIVVDGFPNDNNDFAGPDRVEFKFSPATERENVSKAGLENPNNYVSYVANQDLSTVVFTNVLPAAADPVIVLSASANALNEDANGTITLTATLDAPAASNLTVDLSIGGTAADQI
ncbi:MAG: hypothetical protein KJO73_13470, partial [Croceitalea sp.]|nr:hypothetical protein [Croceitalea sp.]